MSDTSINIVSGLGIPAQIPLNPKQNISNEATLKDLGLNDNLAYTYEKGLIVYCQLEGTRYTWEEVLPGQELTGLRDTDFIYPSGVIVNGVDYSNKKYNFFNIDKSSLVNAVVTAGDNITVTGNGENNTPYVITGLSSPFNSNENSYFPRNRDESQYGEIGEYSYDFSFAKIGAYDDPYGQVGQIGIHPTEQYGALGESVYTFGYNLSGQGYGDTLFGQYNHSDIQSQFSTLFGRNNYNNSYHSLIGGSYNQAPYTYLGHKTIFGQGNLVNGTVGLTSGVALLNKSFSTTVLGQANLDYTNTSEDVNNSTAPILIVGNGNVAVPQGIWSATSRSNALQLLKNGLLTLPSVTNTLISNDITGKAVITKEYLESLPSSVPDGSETKIQAGLNIDIIGNGTVTTPYIISTPDYFTSVGSFHYADLATQTTPQAIANGVDEKILNDALGTYTNISNAPYGVLSVYNTSTNQLDFSSLSVGDLVTFRLDVLMDTSASDQAFNFYLKLGIGSVSEFTINVAQGQVKLNSVFRITEDVSFDIGSEDIRDYPAELWVLSDGNADIVINGYFIEVIRKNINIVSVEDTNAVHKIGNETINDIKTFTGQILLDNTANIQFNNSTYNTILNTDILTANRNIGLPDKSGTIALLSDIISGTPTLQQVTDVGKITTNDITVKGGITIDAANGVGSSIELQNQTGDLIIPSTIQTTGFIKLDGTSNEFLKADGSIDSNTYLSSTPTLQEVTDIGSITTNPIFINPNSLAVGLTINTYEEGNAIEINGQGGINIDSYSEGGFAVKGNTNYGSGVVAQTISGNAVYGISTSTGTAIKATSTNGKSGEFNIGVANTSNIIEFQKNNINQASISHDGKVTANGLIVPTETASTIASFDASKNVKSLSTATYPSLTELSYSKGVTSSIQTQLNGKQSSLGFTPENVANKQNSLVTDVTNTKYPTVTAVKEAVFGYTPNVGIKIDAAYPEYNYGLIGHDINTNVLTIKTASDSSAFPDRQNSLSLSDNALNLYSKDLSDENYLVFNPNTSYTRQSFGSSSFYFRAIDQFGDPYNSSLTRPFFDAENPTTYNWSLPAQSGEIALTSDIPTLPNNIITGTGTVNKLAKFNSSGTITNSNISDDDSNVFITASNVFRSTSPTVSFQTGATASPQQGTFQFATIPDEDMTVSHTLTGRAVYKSVFSNLGMQFLNNNSQTLFLGTPNGNVLINSTSDNTVDKLQVSGSIKSTSSVQVGDNTNIASSSNVGAIRYRTSGNNSYADICMQTGVSTYEWVNIMENNW